MKVQLWVDLCHLYIIDSPILSCYANFILIELCLFLWKEVLHLPKKCVGQDVSLLPVEKEIGFGRGELASQVF